MAEKAPKPCCCFPQHPTGSTLVPREQKAQQRSTASVARGVGLGPAARVLEPGLRHLPQQRGSRPLPKLLMSFARLAATRPAESSRPFTPCFPAYITGLGITLPALLATPAALSLFLPINSSSAKSLLR